MNVFKHFFMFSNFDHTTKFLQHFLEILKIKCSHVLKFYNYKGNEDNGTILNEIEPQTAEIFMLKAIKTIAKRLCLTAFSLTASKSQPFEIRFYQKKL